MNFRLGIAQFQPIKGDVPSTWSKMEKVIYQAVQQQVDLCLFPETALQGYFLEGAVQNIALTQKQVKELIKSLNLQKPLDLCFGFYERDDIGYYNSAVYYSFEGDQFYFYRKFFLPTYGIFDEARFVRPGSELGIVPTRFGILGLLICEDLWHSVFPTLLALNGAHTLLVLAASPARGMSNEIPDNILHYKLMAKSVAEEHGVYVGVSQLVGMEGGKCFSGGSMVTCPLRGTLQLGCLFEEELIIQDLDQEHIIVARKQAPLLADLQSRRQQIKSFF